MSSLPHHKILRLIEIRRDWTDRKRLYNILLRPCPRCGAKPGYRCIVVKTGRSVYGLGHMPRRDAAGLANLAGNAQNPPPDWQALKPDMVSAVLAEAPRDIDPPATIRFKLPSGSYQVEVRAFRWVRDTDSPATIRFKLPSGSYEIEVRRADDEHGVPDPARNAS